MPYIPSCIYPFITWFLKKQPKQPDFFRGLQNFHLRTLKTEAEVLILLQADNFSILPAGPGFETTLVNGRQITG